MLNFRDLKVKWKIILPYSLLVVLIIGAMLLWYSNSELQRLESEQLQKMEIVIQGLAETSAQPLAIREYDRLQEILLNLKKIDQDIVYALLVDKQGHNLLGTDKAAAARSPAVSGATTVTESPSGIKQAVSDVKGVDYELRYPVKFLSIVMGELRIGVSRTRIKEAIKKGVFINLLIGLGTVIIGIVVFNWVVRIGVVKPIQELSEASQKISAGQLKETVQYASRDEIGGLASTFNTMAQQLRDSFATLEQRVADRTRRLEIVAGLSEHLNAILNLDVLLAELVHQVKKSFGYYHAQVYLIDEPRQNLVIATGAGAAGRQMKVAGHRISLDSANNPMTRAVRSAQVVREDDLRATQDWRPNPLLPGALSEMAVPIILNEQVAGVLDVQSNKVAGLDDSDANTLRSLASQVAVAMDNAKVFQAVEQARWDWEVTFNAMRDAVLVLDKDRKVTRSNQALLSLVHRTPSEIEGQQYNEVLKDMSCEQQTCPLEQTMASGRPAACVHECDGRIYEVQTTPVYGGDVEKRDHAVGMIYVMRDVTERKQAEQALHESEEMFRSISASAQDAIVTIDNDGLTTYWNEGAEKIFGYTSEEIVGRDLHSIIVPEKYRDAFYKAFDHFKNTGQGAAIGKTRELTATRRDGTEFPIELSLSSVKIKGKWTAVGMLRDITERKEFEDKLKQSKEFVETVLNSMQDSISIIDVDNYDVVGANNAFLKERDMPEKEVLGQTCYALTHHRDSPCEPPNDPCPLQETLQTGSYAVAEHKHFAKNGEIVYAEVATSPIKGEDGKIKQVVHVARDVTERKLAEDNLKAFAEKLEKSNRELEDFAYIASHDLQEPLRKVQAFGDRLKVKYAENLEDQGRDYLERMQSAAGRMQTLINDLLTFSRVMTKAQPFASVDLGKTAREVVSDLEVRLEQTGGRVDIGELPTIAADPLQMRQLLQNLIGNALKFHKDDEPPVVTVSSQLGSDQSPVNGVCHISVADDGIGFDEKYSDRIFGAFQRLHGRTQYEGTGIGLAVCRKIAERHGGSIAANSTPGQGATFIVTLPVEQAEGANNG